MANAPAFRSLRYHLTFRYHMVSGLRMGSASSRWKQTKSRNLSPFWSRTRRATSTAPRSPPTAVRACKRISRSMPVVPGNELRQRKPIAVFLRELEIIMGERDKRSDGPRILVLGASGLNGGAIVAQLGERGGVEVVRGAVIHGPWLAGRTRARLPSSSTWTIRRAFPRRWRGS